MPAAATRTTTCPGPGCGSGSSVSRSASGTPCFVTWMAFIGWPLVPALLVYDVQQLFPREVPLQVVEQQRGMAVPEPLGHAREVRRNEQVRRCPQRALGRERLDLCDVNRRAGNDSFLERRHQRLLIHQRPAADVDEVGRLLH